MSKKYYAVRVGRKPGIYQSWKECQEQINGFPKQQFKSFEILSQATEYMKGISYENSEEKQREAGRDLLRDKPVPLIEEESYSGKISLPVRLPEEIIIYTDGSCFNADAIRQKQNGQTLEGILSPGGYSAVFLNRNGEELLRLSGGSQKTTNNRMELTAVKEALHYVNDGVHRRIHLVSDSKYLVNSFNNHWVEAWKKNGLQMDGDILWRKKSGDIVKNQDLLKEIDRLRRKNSVEFNYTQGHANNKYNELCDQLAKKQSAMQAGIVSYENQRRREELEGLQSSHSGRIGMERNAERKDMER